MRSLRRIPIMILFSALLFLCACQTKPPSATDTTDASSDVTSHPADESEPLFGGGTSSPSDTAETTEADPTPAADLIIIKPGQRRSTYRIKYDTQSDAPLTAEVEMLRAMVKSYTNCEIVAQDSSQSSSKEIVFSSDIRSETALMKAELSEGEFALRVLPHPKGEAGDLLIATTTYRSAYAAVEYLLESFYTAEAGLCIPGDLDVTGTEKEYTMITSTINKLRDPCILVEDGVYYAYGTGWHCFKNTSGSLEGSWTDLGAVASVANKDTDGGDHWAPEVHKYNGSYYMFTTYKSKITNRHGCVILKSDSPEGPFVEITNGHITPADWDAIDGTFYVDPDGQPWMVFVHEWVSMPGGVGSFAAAKLSDDLTHFISEPIELFKADEPAWAVAGVTDGCWMYTTREGELLMVWSNFDAHGYTVAVARSSNGRLDGEWIHEEKLLYSKLMTGQYDGGHGMVFTDTDGQMYLSFHSPNAAEGNRKEKPVFLALEEKDGKLIWAESEREKN